MTHDMTDAQKLTRLVTLAEACRKIQTDYFRSRSVEMLRKARDAEKALDAFLAELHRPPQQPTLFDNSRGYYD